MHQLNEALGGLIIIAGLVVIVYILAKYTYLIKKMMIEKGIVAPPQNHTQRLIDLACVLFFLGLGVLVSAFYTGLGLTEDVTDMLVWGTILVIGSFGPTVAYLIRSRRGK